MMRRSIGHVLFAGLLLGLTASGVWAGYLDHTVTFAQSDLAVAELDGYDVITLPGCDLTGEIGLPQLPVFSLTLALPAGARIVELEILEAESTELLARFRPIPAQHPRILPVPGFDIPSRPFVGPDPSVYLGRQPYPTPVAELLSTGRLGGARLVGVALHPVQFVPTVGKLRIFRSISVRLHYDLVDEVAPRISRRDQSTVVRVLSDNDAAAPLPSEPRRPLSTMLEAGYY